jgi:glycosyltransferase involved in cell wall biosynthesis
MDQKKKTVLIFIKHFLPGYKFGGPLRTVVNTIERLSPYYDFKIVTSDHDLGETATYAGITPNEWTVLNGHSIYYIQGAWNFKVLKQIIRDSGCDVIYLNGVLDFDASIRVLLLRRLNQFNIPVVVGARGELSPGALSIKKRKKQLYLGAAKVSGLFKGLTFQATSAFEKTDISKAIGSKTKISVVSDLAQYIPDDVTVEGKTKHKGKVKLVFISRLSPKKNLLFNINMLKGIKGEVEFDIYGPIEDAQYWQTCEQAIAEVVNDSVSINYRGSLSNSQVYEVLRQYHFFYFLTLSENFGHVIYEAFASGCPPIISDQTPWRSLEQKKAGWDIALNDEQTIRNVLQRCVDMDNEEYNIMSQRAFDVARDFCNNAEVLEDNVRLFQ